MAGKRLTDNGSDMTPASGRGEVLLRVSRIMLDLLHRNNCFEDINIHSQLIVLIYSCNILTLCVADT